MLSELLSSFLSLDESAFAKLLKHLGYAAGSVYKIDRQGLTFIFGAASGKKLPHWPAKSNLEHIFNYTHNPQKGLPIGWQKPKLGKSEKNLWPEGVIFYFPVQDLAVTKLMLAIVPKDKKVHATSTLDGALEAIAKRFGFWIDNGEMRFFVNETAFEEHTRRLNIDIRTLIDHELRTPLSIIEGYSQLLQSIGSLPADILEYSGIINQHANIAIQSVEKVGVVLRSSLDPIFQKAELKPVNIKDLTKEVCQSILEDQSLTSLYGKRPKISFVAPDDRKEILVNAVPKLVSKALWEVIQNAVIHSHHGNIKATLYTAEESAILDIEDDGSGIPAGSEDLIFLRFYQGINMMKIKRGHRGMGLGLFIARNICEQHGGQLLFVRQTGKNGAFRFIWPTMAPKEPEMHHEENFKQLKTG